MDKSEFKFDFDNVSDSDSLPLKQEEDKVTSNWHPGYRARFPVSGASALFGVLICAAAEVAVLVFSDRKSQTQWTKKLAPNVVIGALNSIGNVLLAVAIAQGIAVAWWRKALNGATVAELHQSWAYSMSTGKILSHFWSLDAVALAALATKLAIVDGIAFQRATSTYITQDPPREVTLLGVVASEFPQTGFVVSEGFAAQTDCNCFMIGDTYTPVVNTWETSNGFFKGFEALFPTCDGVCFTHVDTIGFEIDCNLNRDHGDIATAAVNAFEASLNGTEEDPTQWTDLPIFNSSFSMVWGNGTGNFSHLNLDLLYFDSDNPYNANSASCPGTVSQVRCALRPATVRYPVSVVNYENAHITNGISIGGTVGDVDNTNSPAIPEFNYLNKQAEGFEVLEYIQLSEQNTMNTTTRLGGIANALSQFLSSSASITYTNSSLWALKQQGTLAQTMMFGPPNMGTCDCSFHDALSTIVAEINQLAFLTATGLIDRSSYSTPTINASTEATIVGVRENTTTTFHPLTKTQQISDVIHYQTHYLYMALGVASLLCCILLVIPSFWRYGELGRDVTLGPMEIASAFRAPILVTGEGDAEAARDVNDLIQQVGDRKVMYGFVEDTRGSGATGADHRRSMMLCMEEPTRVRPVSMWSSPSTPRSYHFPSSPRM